MPQFKEKLLSVQFATGVTFYRDHYPGEGKHTRMVLRIKVNGRHNPVQTIVDTGSQWCVFDPGLVGYSAKDSSKGYVSEESLMIRGSIYRGKLLRMSVNIEATYGESLALEATVFVPMLLHGEAWPHPNFVGLEGFLHRIRFAVDPSENAFYFGPV